MKLIQYANGPSLEEINGTVEVPHGKGFWRTLFAYSGPGALVARELVHVHHRWSKLPVLTDFRYSNVKFDCDAVAVHGS